MMLSEPFTKASSILNTLASNGYEGYFVGGCVRDFLLKKDIHDIDIATSATPSEVITLFPKVIPVGMEHGTVIVRQGGESYEVTTYRLDGEYTDYRRPNEVRFVTNLAEDLRRRDFTMNALAMDSNGRITDLFHGKEDLEKKLIRTVGNAEERFQEDALRILRAVRFSSQLGCTIQADTFQAMYVIRSQIQHLAVERITAELTKLFQGYHVAKAIQYIIDLRLDEQLPIFEAGNSDIFKEIKKNIIPLQSFSEVIAVFHQLEPTIKIHDWIRKYKCSNHIKNDALKLINAFQFYRSHGLDNWLLYILPKKLWAGWIRLVFVMDHTTIQHEQLEEIDAILPIKERADLDVNGNDLIDWFPQRSKGKWIKQILEEIEYLVVTMQLANEKKIIKEWVLCNQQEPN
ncbi:CCA tRNA nucleotidyltransferase [Oceanobacillus sp. 1P07AA]|uniref:CCA tRNA nucleotidyltransferase n=1 Tax=Oceanobacillus sp. 1P07AA TaxID=3132293 RepID=UPI0039A40342